jgi:ABC-type nitrate/sulfonate/bicarbonate transport system ATPase subunit
MSDAVSQRSRVMDTPSPANPTVRGSIEIAAVGKHYAQRRGSRNVVLSNVNLKIRPREFVSIVGKSGCGKTTLLRMIGGLAPYSEGEISVGGQRVSGVPAAIGFCFQEAALLPWRTVRQNVAVGLNESRQGLSKDEIAGRVDDQLKIVGLTKFAGYYPRQLSGGMQQRAGLARALVGQPEVLLLDEPFGALDPFTRLRLQEELAEIVARTSATSVLVTHDVDEAVFLSDRVAVMSNDPGMIREDVVIDLPRPRLKRAQLLDNQTAAGLRDHITRLVIGD